jgi:hypothetical protein
MKLGLAHWHLQVPDFGGSNEGRPGRQTPRLLPQSVSCRTAWTCRPAHHDAHRLGGVRAPAAVVSRSNCDSNGTPTGSPILQRPLFPGPCYEPAPNLAPRVPAARTVGSMPRPCHQPQQCPPKSRSPPTYHLLFESSFITHAMHCMQIRPELPSGLAFALLETYWGLPVIWPGPAERARHPSRPRPLRSRAATERQA